MPSLMRPILGADASPNVVRVALTAQMMLDKDALERGREEHISLISQRRSRWNCVTAARIADQLRREGLIA